MAGAGETHLLKQLDELVANQLGDVPKEAELEIWLALRDHAYTKLIELGFPRTAGSKLRKL